MWVAGEQGNCCMKVKAFFNERGSVRIAGLSLYILTTLANGQHTTPPSIYLTLMPKAWLKPSNIDIFDLPVEVRQFEYRPKRAAQPEDKANTKAPRHHLTRDYLLEILQSSDWNKAEVSRRIGLSRAAVWKYMKKWDISQKKPLKRTSRNSETNQCRRSSTPR